MMEIENHLKRLDMKQEPPAGLRPADTHAVAFYGDQGQFWTLNDTLQEELKHWKYQTYIKDYLRCVAGVDRAIGRVLDYLEDTGLAENTLVVYTSDQGFYLGEHGWFDKEDGRGVVQDALGSNARCHRTREHLGCDGDECGFRPNPAGLCRSRRAGRDAGRELQVGPRWGAWRRDPRYYHYYEYPKWHKVSHYGIRTDRYKLILLLLHGRMGAVRHGS